MSEDLNTSLTKIDYSWEEQDKVDIKNFIDDNIDEFNYNYIRDDLSLKDIYSIRSDLLIMRNVEFNHNLYLDDNISKQNKSLNYISSKISNLDKIIETNNSLNKQFEVISKNNEDIVLKLSEIEKKSDNEVIKEEFKQLSDDIVTTINNNNINNISLLVGVIIGISIINVFFHQYSNKL